MPNLKIFATIVFFVAILVVGLEYLPKFYAQPTSVETMTHLEGSQIAEEKVLKAKDKEESNHKQIGYRIIGYFLLFSLLLYTKILIQRNKRLE